MVRSQWISAWLDGLAPRRCAACALCIDSDDRLFCDACEPLLEAQSHGIGAFEYGGPMADAIRRFKYARHPEFGAGLAERMLPFALRHHAGLVDEVMPVPLHPSRVRERGFSPAVCLARPIAHALGVPLELRALHRVRRTEPQVALSRRDRAANLRGAFRVEGKVVSDRVLLVDDVLTTGATLHEAGRALRVAGVKQVRYLTLASASG